MLKYLCSILLIVLLTFSFSFAKCPEFKTQSKDGKTTVYATKALERGKGKVPFYWTARVDKVTTPEGKTEHWFAVILFHNENDELEINMTMLDEAQKQYFPAQYIYQYQTREEIMNKGFDIKDLNTHRIAVEQAWFFIKESTLDHNHDGSVDFTLVHSRENSFRLISIDPCYFQNVM